MDNGGVPTHGNFTITKPCNALAHILNVFACDSHNNIAWFSLFLLCCLFVTNMADWFRYKQIKFCVNLSVMNTGKPVLPIIFFLKVPSAGDGSNIAESFIYNTIGA